MHWKWIYRQCIFWCIKKKNLCTFQLYIYIIHIWTSENDRRVTWLRKFPAGFPTSRHLFFVIFKTKCVVQSSFTPWDASFMLICGLRVSQYSRRLRDARHTDWKNTLREVCGLSSKKGNRAHVLSLQSHFILCSLLAAIFLFMLNRCIVVDLLVISQRNKKHTQTYFVCSRRWQYLHKILVSRVHTHVHTGPLDNF